MHTLIWRRLPLFIHIFNQLIHVDESCTNVFREYAIRMIRTKRQCPDNNDDRIPIYHFGTSTWFLHHTKNIAIVC